MSRNKEKGTLVEADPEPEKTLKRKSRETKINNSEKPKKKREKGRQKASTSKSWEMERFISRVHSSVEEHLTAHQESMRNSLIKKSLRYLRGYMFLHIIIGSN